MSTYKWKPIGNLESKHNLIMEAEVGTISIYEIEGEMNYIARTFRDIRKGIEKELTEKGFKLVSGDKSGYYYGVSLELGINTEKGYSIKAYRYETDEEYKKRKEKRKKELEQEKQQKLEREKKEYIRLKKKFENQQ